VEGILFRLELSRYFSNIDRTKVSSLPWAMLLYNFYIFCVPECLFNPSVITTFFVIAHSFREKFNENSLYSSDSACSRFAYSAVKRLQWYYWKSRFHQCFADQSYEQRASCKGESLSAIVQEKFSLKYTFSSLFFRRAKTRGRESKPSYIITGPVYLIIMKMCAEVETRYLMNFETTKGSI